MTTSDDDTFNEEKGKVHEELEAVTTRELRGWCLASTGFQPYVVAVMSVFVPIILETYSSQAGFKLEDNNVPCDIEIEDYKCVTKFGFWLVDSTSYSFYIIALSVFAQCFVYFGIGSLADFENNRKKMFLGFGYAGALFTIGFIFVLNPNMYWLAGLLTILSNVGFGTAFVCWLAYIPVYTRIHPEVLEVGNGGTEEEIYEIKEKISNQLSVMSLIWSIPASVFVLAICSVIALLMEDKMLSLRIGCGIVGIWWIAFLTFPALWTKNRAGSPLPKNANYLTYSFKRVGKTMKSARQLVETMKFMIAWFIVTDAYSTVLAVGTLFGKKVLGLSQVQLLIVAMIIPTSAVVGAYILLKIQQYFNQSTKKMIIIIFSLHSLVPMYALLGFVAPIGFKQTWEIWLFAVYYGFFLGGSTSFCRAFFGHLIPKGHETEFYSLHEITDQGSSWLGPLIAGIIGDVTHDLRYSYWFLLITMVAPILIVLSVDFDKGIKDAELFVENEKKLMGNEKIILDEKPLGDEFEPVVL